MGLGYKATERSWATECGWEAECFLPPLPLSERRGSAGFPWCSLGFQDQELNPSVDISASEQQGPVFWGCLSGAGCMQVSQLLWLHAAVGSVS